jgi:polyhydroxybutyrate depolymerase
MRRLIAIVAGMLGTALALAGCTASAAPARPTSVAAAHSSVTVQVAGTTRSFLLRSPAHRATEKLPLVIALHGAGGNAAAFERYVGLDSLVAKQRLVMAYPNGSPLSGDHLAWNAGGCCSRQGMSPADDVGFLRVLIARVVADDGVDARRVYLVGFSNGGMLAYRAACDLGDLIAGIVVVSGAYNVASCEQRNAMPLDIVHGTADPTVPYGGGQQLNPSEIGLRPWTNRSVADAVAAWRDRDACTASASVVRKGPVEEKFYRGCGSGSDIAVYTVRGGDHSWPKPGTVDVAGLIAGMVNATS